MARDKRRQNKKARQCRHRLGVGASVVRLNKVQGPGLVCVYVCVCVCVCVCEYVCVYVCVCAWSRGLPNHSCAKPEPFGCAFQKYVKLLTPPDLERSRPALTPSVRSLTGSGATFEISRHQRRVTDVTFRRRQRLMT